MALYSYTKSKKNPLKRVLSFFSVSFVVSGLSILVWTVYPIFSFQFFYQPRFANLIRPVAEADEKENMATNIYQVLGTNFQDFTQASVWFPKASAIKLAHNLSGYDLSIPKLGIKKAYVDIGGEDLSKSLIQFTGPLPGNFGNPVVFGHSTLLWFYNPADYKSIFSKLPDLETNDEILVDVDDITYTFRVKEMYITSPTDLSVLNQTDEKEMITLITCVPPGTYLKRFIVKAELDKI